jgi:hypothetical protein
MKVVSRLAALCAVMVVASSGAWADPDWHYHWGGNLIGSVHDGYSGYGGIFDGYLYDANAVNGASNPWTRYSVCNELDQYISGGSDYQVAVWQLTNLTSDELNTPTFGPPQNNHDPHYARDAERGAIAWLIANHLDDYAVNPGASSVNASALQSAVWYLWGFTNVPMSSTANALVTEGRLHPNYYNEGVLWLHNYTSDMWFQDQITFVNGTLGHDGVGTGVVPEASSLLLLLPGLVPLGLLARKRSKA